MHERRKLAREGLGTVSALDNIGLKDKLRDTIFERHTLDSTVGGIAMNNPSQKDLRIGLLAIAILLGTITFAILAPMARGQRGNATSAIDVPTETATPADWWYRDLPPEKRSVEETDVARRATAALSAHLRRPTRPIKTAEPLVLTGRQAGAGVIIEDDPYPFAHGSVSVSSDAWGVATADENIVIFAGALVDDPAQGVVIIFHLSRDGTRDTRPIKTVKSPVQVGKLYVKGAEDVVVLLGSEKGEEVRFDVTKEEFVGQ